MQAPRPDAQPVWVALNGLRRIVLSCSPHEPAALALGHLIGEGWARTAADVHTLDVSHGDGRTGITAHVDPAQLDAFELVRRHQLLHGCGLRHVLECDPYAIEPVEQPALPVDATALLRELFAAVDEHSPGGGVHGAALSDGDTLLSMSTDVARHCAVDRALGLALAQRDDVSGLGLVTTARVSGAMALKAIRARLGWIASRSIATSLAREVAEHYGLLLLERAGRQDRDA